MGSNTIEYSSLFALATRVAFSLFLGRCLKAGSFHPFSFWGDFLLFVFGEVPPFSFWGRCLKAGSFHPFSFWGGFLLFVLGEVPPFSFWGRCLKRGRFHPFPFWGRFHKVRSLLHFSFWGRYHPFFCFGGGVTHIVLGSGQVVVFFHSTNG